MAKQFYTRLKTYFEQVGKILRGEADSSSIFPNTSDIGVSREVIYAEFLRQHAPSKCNIYLGGFLFGEDGSESKQLDVLISTDTAPRYNFHNRDGAGKSFGPVEGCLGVASIKSTLDKHQLTDALKGIASIPPTQPIGNRVNPLLKIREYEDWPYKIIYASNGLKRETIIEHLYEFYAINNHIPLARRPNIIHVAGQYAIFRIKEGQSIQNADGTIAPTRIGDYHAIITNSDTQALLWTINELQSKAVSATHINFNYTEIINKVNEIR